MRSEESAFDGSQPGAPVGVSQATASDFLRARFGVEANSVVPLAHGEWSSAYAFRRGEAEYVVRFSELREDFEKDALAARRDSAALPIPTIVELGEALSGFYAISERVPGAHIDSLGGVEMRRLLPALFLALDAARRVDLSATTGYGGWGSDGHAPHPTWKAFLLDVATDRPTRRTHGWRARPASSPTGSGPFDDAFEKMQRLLDPCPEERHLVHSDLLHYNVLAAGDRITAILDWGSSVYGDFLYDLAWLMFWSPWYPAWRSSDFRREAAAHYSSSGVSVPYLEERLRCYQIRVGLDGQAYSAIRGRWVEVDAIAQRTLEVAADGR